MMLRHTVAAALAVTLLSWLGGCVRLHVASETRSVAAADGCPLTYHRLVEWRWGGPAHANPRGTVFYIQGSEPAPVLRATESLAGACAMGFDVVMVERRGVSPDGAVDRAEFDAACTKPLRVTDQQRVIDDALARRETDGPVILVGTSEGGDIAAAVAAQEPRITHIMLLGSGGGWTQEEEFREFVGAGKGGTIGAETDADLDAALARLRADPDSTDHWLGLPHRRWTTFMFERAGDDLRSVQAPILLVHGDADASVPVGSARALRDLFGAWGKSNLTYVELAGVDHHFVHVADGRRAMPLVEVALVEWMAHNRVLGTDEAAKFVRRVKKSHPEWFDGAGTPRL